MNIVKEMEVDYNEYSLFIFLFYFDYFSLWYL